MLQSMREIDLIIRTLRVNCLDSTLYEWFNPIEQRPTSPPPSTYLSNNALLTYPEKTVRSCLSMKYQSIDLSLGEDFN